MSKLSVIANIAAVALLGGGLTYYNFIDKAPVSEIVVGQECPNFIAKPYQVQGDTFSVSSDVFTLTAQKGKVCVVNFWETWCQACIEELPEFNEIQVEYGERIEVVAIVGTTSSIGAAAEWMTNKGWKAYDSASDWTDFSLTFAYLPMDVCADMGCTGMLPRTIIVDGKGIVAHQQNGAMSYAELQAIVEPLLLKDTE